MSTAEQVEAPARKSAGAVESGLAKLFLLFSTLALCLVALEVASWWILDTRSPVEKDYPVRHIRQPAPYVMFGGTPEARGLNCLGYPGRAPAQLKPDGELRIFVAGGSTVFRGDPPIPEMLEQIAHGAGHGEVRVYNFGVVSSVSGMELARLVTEMVDLRPDLVVFYGGGNDLHHPFDYDPRPGHPFNFMVYESNPTLANDVHDYPRLPLLLYGSHLARFFLADYFVDSFVPRERLRREAGWNTDPWRRQIALRYWSNLEKARVIAGAYDAGVLAVFQPLLYFKDHPSADEAPHVDAEEGEHCRRARQLLRQLVAPLPEARRAHFVDASDLFKHDTGTVFTDLIHIEQDDRRRVAEEIFRHIKPRLGPPTSDAAP